MKGTGKDVKKGGRKAGSKGASKGASKGGGKDAGPGAGKGARQDAKKGARKEMKQDVRKDAGKDMKKDVRADDRKEIRQDMVADSGPRKCGFVAVIGAPNAGKSTLINTLVGGKVTIVSSKVQTTRSIIRGIALHKGSQIILADTPGLFAPRRRLDRAMVAAAWGSRDEADLIMLVSDASKARKGQPDTPTAAILKRMEEEGEGKPCILVLNKVDNLRPQELLPLAQAMNERFPFAATFMISALRARGVDRLLDYLAAHLPDGDWHYPEDQLSDLPMRMLAAEITREKLFRLVHNELPHNLTVETESWDERADGSVFVHQVITVARETHRPIVLGKGGSLISEAGAAARRELEEITETRVHLKLFVRVDEGWMDDPEHYAAWGLDFRS